MSDDDLQPENADESQPASTLHTTWTCAHAGCKREFDSADELARHTAQCEAAGDNVSE